MNFLIPNSNVKLAPALENYPQSFDAWDRKCLVNVKVFKTKQLSVNPHSFSAFIPMVEGIIQESNSLLLLTCSTDIMGSDYIESTTRTAAKKDGSLSRDRQFFFSSGPTLYFYQSNSCQSIG